MKEKKQYELFEVFSPEDGLSKFIGISINSKILFDSMINKPKSIKWMFNGLFYKQNVTLRLIETFNSKAKANEAKRSYQKRYDVAAPKYRQLARREFFQKDNNHNRRFINDKNILY
jgi:hypothetical protein